MGSDRLALDHLAAKRSPMERLATRVSELEHQVQRLQTTHPAMTLPKAQVWNVGNIAVGSTSTQTYTPNGGYCVILTTHAAQGTGAGTFFGQMNLWVDVATPLLTATAAGSGIFWVGAPAMYYVVGQRSDPFVIGLQNDAASNVTLARVALMVVELPYTA